MRAVKSKKAFYLFRHPLSNLETKQMTAWLISCRLLLIFSFACAVGVFFSVSSSAATRHHELMQAYWDSFFAKDIFLWLTNAIRNSAFDASLLLTLWLSALTFFCPATVHLIVLFSGLTYGICIGIVTDSSAEDPRLALLYIISTSTLAIFIARWSTALLRFNRQCIASRGNHTKGNFLYVSPLLRQYLRQGLVATVFLLVYRLTFSLVITLIHLL